MMYLQQGMQPPEPQEQYSRLRELLQQEHYEVVPVRADADSRRCPPDADLLVVMASTPLNERQAWEINRALHRGHPRGDGRAGTRVRLRPRRQAAAGRSAARISPPAWSPCWPGSG